MESANQSGMSGSGRTSPEYDDELCSVWEGKQLEPVKIPTRSTTITPAIRKTTPPQHQGIFLPPPSSPVPQTNAANLPPSDFEAAVSDPDSDFELVDSDTPSHLDGAAERSNRSYNYIPTALKEQYSARTRKLKPTKQEHINNDDDEDWDAVPGSQNPIDQPRMEGDNDYEQPEWRQAGPNADAQDLAGPGEHGTLECTVTKPQKEGEGTQNVYVSYLVTTDVRSTILETTELRLTSSRPTSNLSKPPIKPHAVDLPTSSSFTRRSSKNTLNALCHLYRRSRTCPMFVAIASALTLQLVAHIPYNGFSSA
jgi:hypothetical protein